MAQSRVKKERPDVSAYLEERSHECSKNKNLIKNIRIQGLYYNLPYKKSRVPLEGRSAASTGRLEVLVDAAKAVLLVFCRHFDEVTQAFLELLRSLSCAIDEPDPDPFIGI